MKVQESNNKNRLLQTTGLEAEEINKNFSIAAVPIYMRGRLELIVSQTPMIGVTRQKSLGTMLNQRRRLKVGNWQ